jgi:DNA-binding MarR family transcriptional regulator
MSSGHNKPATRARSNPKPKAGRAKAGARAGTAPAAAPVSAAAREFLDLFYPVHYKVGIGIEDALRGGRLTRHQVAILWLIRSEGVDGRSITRKDIERSITRWFEIGNSAISKALRVLAKAPYGWLEIQEHPTSGRERLVVLTPAGLAQLDEMIAQGHRFLQRMVDYLSDTESSQGVHFLTRVSAIIDIVDKPALPPPAAGSKTARRVRR